MDEAVKHAQISLMNSKPSLLLYGMFIINNASATPITPKPILRKLFEVLAIFSVGYLFMSNTLSKNFVHNRVTNSKSSELKVFVSGSTNLATLIDPRVHELL